MIGIWLICQIIIDLKELVETNRLNKIDEIVENYITISNCIWQTNIDYLDQRIKQLEKQVKTKGTK